MAGRILVIRGGAIGDFILTLPAIKLLRDNFPEAHIEILGYKHIVALAENRYYAQATRSIEYSAMSNFFIPNAMLAEDLVEYFGSFHQVISYLYDPDGIFQANIRRCGVKYFVEGQGKLDDSDHAAEQLARPLQALALYLEDRGAEVFPHEADRAAAAALLAGVRGPTIAIHPGSGSTRKNWMTSRWAELGQRLFTDVPGLELLLLGGEADRMAVEDLAHAWAGKPVRLLRDVPLPSLAAALEKTSLFLGHDSGISHLAAAARTRCLLLFGATDPGVWAPANRYVRVLEAPGNDMAQLTVEAVRQAVLEQWQQIHATGSRDA